MWRLRLTSIYIRADYVAREARSGNRGREEGIGGYFGGRVIGLCNGEGNLGIGGWDLAVLLVGRLRLRFGKCLLCSIPGGSPHHRMFSFIL